MEHNAEMEQRTEGVLFLDRNKPPTVRMAEHVRDQEKKDLTHSDMRYEMMI